MGGGQRLLIWGKCGNTTDEHVVLRTVLTKMLLFFAVHRRSRSQALVRVRGVATTPAPLLCPFLCYQRRCGRRTSCRTTSWPWRRLGARSHLGRPPRRALRSLLTLQTNDTRCEHWGLVCWRAPFPWGCGDHPPLRCQSTMILQIPPKQLR